jgi:hypothetical protein
MLRKSNRCMLMPARCCLGGSYHMKAVRPAVGSTDNSCFGAPSRVDGEESELVACQRWLMRRHTQGMGMAEMEPELGMAGEELSGMA